MEADAGFVFGAAPQRIVFGGGRIAELGVEAARLGMARAVLVCSPSRPETTQRAADALGDACAAVCDAAVREIPAEAFARARADLDRAGADGIVVLGGGSAIGLGKALACDTALPLIALPTTYSGSELMQDWYVGRGTDARRGEGPAARAKTVIYDPELTHGLPPAVSGPSGMNAMAHAAESLYSAHASPVSLMMGEEGIRLLGASLPAVVKNPEDADARAEALTGAWLAGGFRAGSCLSHRIAQSLRRIFSIAHAESHAVVLPYAVAFNEASNHPAMARIARALGAPTAAAGLFGLIDALGIKPTLSDLGVPEDGLDGAAEVIAERPIPNPRPVGRAEIRAVLDAAFHGRRRL